MAGSQSWLLPDHFDRERMVDMDRRLRPYRLITISVLGLALIASIPWVGYWTLVPLLCAGALFRLAGDRIGSGPRPEYAIFIAWIASQVLIAVSVLLAGDAGAPALGWLAIPVIGLSARFSYRGVALGVGITLALLAAVGFLSTADRIAEAPTTLIAPAALVIAVAALSSALMRSDIDHRGEAVIDPLTGMLNRKALSRRVEELRQQAEVSGAAVGLIVLDIDHFKRVNDTIGHSTGDAVLRDIGYILRKQMRAYELAYRLGGEEFVVLLPGAGGDDAERIAEEVRATIASSRFAEGVEITVSCGVAASGAEGFDFDQLFVDADAALYEAKRAGRNRVARAPGEGGLPVLA